MTLKSWVQKFREFGATENLNKKSPEKQTFSGRPITARTAGNIVRVMNSIDECHETPTRRRCLQLGLSRSTLGRILKCDLHLRPYHIQVKQKLRVADKQDRRVMCQWFIERLEENDDFLNELWFSDEAHFHLCGYVNSRNAVYWGSHPPPYCLQRPLHPEKVTVWVALSPYGLIGPFFFEDEEGKTETVNTDRYIGVLKKFWAALGRMRHLQRNNQWLMQDGANPHVSARSLAWLEEHFEDRLISRKTQYVWAPHSPDLNPLDFFLWGYLKDTVFANRFEDKDDLKDAIRAAVRNTPRETCIASVQNFRRRIAVCLQSNGGHIEHRL